MSHLIDLSKRLKVRAEVLQERIARTGQEAPLLNAELPEELTDMLVQEFRHRRASPAKQWLQNLFSRPQKTSRPEAPILDEPVEDQPDLFLEREREESEAVVEAPEPLPEPPPTILEELPEIPELLDEDESVPEGVSHPVEPTASDNTFDVEPDAPTLVEIVPSEEEGPAPPPPESDLVEVSDFEVFPPESKMLEPPEEGVIDLDDSADGEEDSGVILASLEQIEKMRESLAELTSEEPSEDEPLDLPDLDEEQPSEEETGEFEEEPESLPEEEGTLEEPIPSEETPLDLMEDPESPYPLDGEGSLSSGELQAMLDGLIDESGLHEEAKEDAPHPNVLLNLMNRGVEFFGRLSPKEKMFLGSAVAVATAILATGIFINRHNYGVGGDERFYQQGLAYQEEGDYDSATEAYSKVIERYSGSPFTVDAHFRIAEIQRAREDYGDADRAMRQGLLLQQNRIGNLSDDWSADDLQKRWNGFFFVGEVNLAREEWDSASEWFSKVIEESSDSSLAQRALYGNADAAYNLAADDRAETYHLRNTIKAYEAALEASPESKNSQVAKFRLGQTWERLAGREVGFAERHLKKALSYLRELQDLGEEVSKAGLDPLDITLEVARLNRELGRIEESINSLRQVMALPRDEFEEGPLPYRVPFGLARSLLAHAEVAIQDNNPNLAQQDLVEVLELVRDRNEDPFTPEEEAESMYIKGHAYYQLGRMDVRTTGADETPYYPKMDASYQRALDLDAHFGRDGDDSLLASMRRTNYHFQINEDYKVSADSYQAILEEFPKNRYSYLARFRLAEALFHREKYAEAEEQYRLVVDQFTSTQYTDDQAFRESYFQLGYCQFLQQEYGPAAQTYKTLLQLLNYEDSEEALQAWKRLAWAYYRQGMMDEAVAECRGFLSKYPDRDTEGKVRMSLGVALLRRFDYEDARKEFRTVVDKYPHSRNARDAHYQICQSYLSECKLALDQEKKNLYQEALKEAKRIREIYNDDDRILAIMGEIYFGLEDYTLARVYLEEYKNCARQHVIPADNLLHLAEACYRLEDYQNAAATFQQVAMGELPRGEAARALFLYGESLRLNKQFPKAIETYEKMMEEFPTSPLRDMAEGRVEEVRWKMKWGIP